LAHTRSLFPETLNSGALDVLAVLY
jgi:hypothetical protein